MSERLPPSSAAIGIATAILGIVVGYFIGSASSLGLFSSSPSSSSTSSSLNKHKKSWPNSYDVDLHPDSSDEELMRSLRGDKAAKAEAETNDDDDGDEEEEEEEEEKEQDGLKAFEDIQGECKLVLIVRTDLGMNKGKIAAQASHATLYNYKALTSHAQLRSLLRRWESTGQAKIALQANSEEQLEELQAKAMSLGLVARVVRDAGRTQIPAGSATVLGVGPGPKAVVDEVSGGLKLL
ncbi:hypothetical protein MMC31_001447 [Peltigera leucophlebia]|nr:hypothetical protein [Peltigera leucophlebia]